MPIFTILNYDIKNNKQAIQYIVECCMSATKCSMHKVSKQGLIIDKNIMYMTNHVSSLLTLMFYIILLNLLL